MDEVKGCTSNLVNQKNAVGLVRMLRDNVKLVTEATLYGKESHKINMFNIREVFSEYFKDIVDASYIYYLSVALDCRLPERLSYHIEFEFEHGGPKAIHLLLMMPTRLSD